MRRRPTSSTKSQAREAVREQLVSLKRTSDSHPAHRFILYLLVSMEDPTLQSVCATLQLYGLAPCTPACFARAFEEVNPIPAGFNPAARAHAESRNYLRKLRIYSLFHPEPHTQEMRDRILPDPRLRMRIETLLLGKVQPHQIARRLTKDGERISHEAVEEFRHYFWNVEGMSFEDWGDYFVSDEGGRTWRFQSTLASALHCGSEVALQRAGLTRSLDMQEVLERMALELDATFREIQQLPLSAAKVEMMNATIRTMLRVDERRQESDAALQEVLKRFERFRMRQDPAKLPTLGTLAPTGSIGDYSREEIRMSREEP